MGLVSSPIETQEPTPFNLILPAQFVYINPPDIPTNNPLTVEGIALGRKLFFEKKLSKNNSLSCFEI